MFNFDDIKEYITNLLQERFGLATAVAVTAASAVLLYLTSSGPKALEYPIPLEQQSVEVEVSIEPIQLAILLTFDPFILLT